MDPTAEGGRGRGLSRDGRYRLVLFLGLAPILLIGFLCSALANRTIFAAWSFLVGGLYFATVWFGFRRGWGGWLLGGRMLLVFAAGMALFARLAAREHEDLDLGLRAFAPAIYRPSLSDPRSGVYAAIFFAVCGVLLILISHGAGRNSSLLRRPK